jgi:hypothetical protein
LIEVTFSAFVPLVTNQIRMFLLSPDNDDDSNFARLGLQDKANDDNTIKVGNYMDLENITSLFKFADTGAKTIFIEPPVECKDIETK